jgi:WD40 repeat protein
MTKNPPEAVDELKDFRVTDISPDGSFLVGGFDKGITLWDIAQRKAVWQFAGHPGNVNDIKFTPDGNSLITGGTQDRLAIRWDISTRKAVMRVPHQAQVTAVVCTGGKSGIWASLSDDGTVKIWGLNPGLDHSIIRLDKPIKTLVTMPFGRAVMLGGDFQAKTWDLYTETFHDSPSAARYVRSISTDGRWLASTESVEPGNVPGAIIWDLSSGKLQHVIAMPDNKFPEVTRISPEGKRLATSRFDGSIQIWDLTGERVEVPAPLSIQDTSCTHLDFSPDGHRLAAACQFGWVNLYDLETNEIVRLRIPRCSWAKRVAFSRDGKLLAVGNDVGLVCIFNIETGNTIASLTGHEASIEALAFFPDGRRLAVASRNTIRIWDVPSSQEMITLTVATGADVSTPIDVKDLAIIPDGRTLLSRQSDGTVRVWNSVGLTADPGDEPVAESSSEPAK